MAMIFEIVLCPLLLKNNSTYTKCPLAWAILFTEIGYVVCGTAIPRLTWFSIAWFFLACTSSLQKTLHNMILSCYGKFLYKTVITWFFSCHKNYVAVRKLTVETSKLAIIIGFSWCVHGSQLQVEKSMTMTMAEMVANILLIQ